jgi:type IV secretory pathway TrbL component
MNGRVKPLYLFVVAIVAFAGAPAHSGDVASDMKKAGKSIAKAATKFGHEVAKGGREVGESVADATEEGAKTAWFSTRDWATRESKQVAHATVRFWDDVIRGKETTRDQLRRENEALKAKAAERNR